MADYDEWDAKAGLIEPEFIQELDGYYTKTIKVNPTAIVVQVMGEETPIGYISETEVAFESVDLPVAIPRYRTALTWKSWNE